MKNTGIWFWNCFQCGTFLFFILS